MKIVWEPYMSSTQASGYRRYRTRIDSMLTLELRGWEPCSEIEVPCVLLRFDGAETIPLVGAKNCFPIEFERKDESLEELVFVEDLEMSREALGLARAKIARMLATIDQKIGELQEQKEPSRVNANLLKMGLSVLQPHKGNG